MQMNFWKHQYRAAPYLFIAPFFLSFLLFSLFPLLYSVYASFMDWSSLTSYSLAGFSNYTKLLGDERFWQAMWNCIIILIMHVPLMLFIALLLAVLLGRPLMKGKGVYRTAIFVPNVISVIAVAFVFSILLNRDEGLLNGILISAGLTNEPISWLETPGWARVSVAMMVLYRWTGYNMLLMLAGLQNIPKDLYESAHVDGATPFQSFIHITVPSIKKILVFCLILSTIGTFSLFTEPYVLTEGGPLNATLTPVLLLYREAFEKLDFGYASAIAVSFFILMMVIALIQLRLFEDRDEA